MPDAPAPHATVRRLIVRAQAADEQGIYLLAALSQRYPVVEVRIADACLDADTAVLLAVLARALVATARAQARQHAPALTASSRHFN